MRLVVAVRSEQAHHRVSRVVDVAVRCLFYGVLDAERVVASWDIGVPAAVQGVVKDARDRWSDEEPRSPERIAGGYVIICSRLLFYLASAEALISRSDVGGVATAIGSVALTSLLTNCPSVLGSALR